MLDNAAIINQEQTYTSGVYGKRDLAIIQGSGALLWDAEGREYIDCAAGHGVANIGHGRPEIAAALAAQAGRLITCPEIVYNDVRAALLERLACLTPSGLDHIFLCNSGTEAIEGALKFARLATGRTGIVAMLRSFHGRSMGALSATWEPHYREPFAPLIPGVWHIRYNNLPAAQEAVTGETAAVVVELVQGEGGVHVATREYITALADLCRERGALLIIDEVQTGFGRTGQLFACEHYGVQPDILCLAKALAGGVPMGAICLGPRVMESGRITRGVHGSTFGGNPLACAAALATLDIIEREALPQRAAQLGNLAIDYLRSLNSPLIREVRGMGLMLGIELTRRAQPYLEALLEGGVLALPAGPNVVRLLPPLVITEEQLMRALQTVAQVLGAEQPIHLDAPAQSINTEAHENREVELLRSMLTIPSLSGQENALSHFLVGQARAMGLHAWVDEVGNFIASTSSLHPDGSTTDNALVMLGHLDTVSGHIPVRIEDGLLYGRGAVDAKGPLAAFLCAVARVAAAGKLERPLVVIGAVEEESASSRGARAVVERYRPAACIIGEPSGSQAVTLGYKGRLLVHGTVSRPSSHSAGPQQSSNELAAAFWEHIRSNTSAWNAEHAGDSAFASLQPSLRSIQSEHDGLQERTRFLIGYRLPPNYDTATLRVNLRAWAEEMGITISFSGEEAAYRAEPTTPLARAFVAALRATGQRPIFKHKTGTSDMNVVGPVWGGNIVAYGPGDSHLDHTPNEHIRLDEYLHAIDVLENVLRRYTGSLRDIDVMGNVAASAGSVLSVSTSLEESQFVPALSSDRGEEPRV